MSLLHRLLKYKRDTVISNDITHKALKNSREMLHKEADLVFQIRERADKLLELLEEMKDEHDA